MWSFGLCMVVIFGKMVVERDPIPNNKYRKEMRVMKLDKQIANLVFELEYLIGQECYNPNSYDGYTGEEGRSFRYPVYIYTDKKSTEPTKYWRQISGVSPEQIRTMKYKFGSNHLFIGEGIVNILGMLEKRYGIDFNELEKQKDEK